MMLCRDTGRGSRYIKSVGVNNEWDITGWIHIHWHTSCCYHHGAVGRICGRQENPSYESGKYNQKVRCYGSVRDLIFPCRKIILQHITEISRVVNESEDWSEIRLPWFKVAVLEHTHTSTASVPAAVASFTPLLGWKAPKVTSTLTQSQEFTKNLCLSLSIGSLPLNLRDVIRLLIMILMFEVIQSQSLLKIQLLDTFNF